MVRFLESNGYDVSYSSGVDTDRRGAELLEHKVVHVASGHDEYWSGTQRANVEAARDAGVHLAFFSRQRGLLEDPLGEQHRRHRHGAPHAGVATRRPTPTPRSTRSPTCGPAPGATRASAPRPKPKLSPGNTIQIVGQIQSMNDSFRDLGIGLLFAAVFVFALMVVNYQNFGDPFVVILALPATLCGILVMLFITGTTLNVPSLMGAIMAVGVASANSILLVTFAHEQQLAGRNSFEAAVDAGHTRIRPVLMTAAAMIVGMLPMAIGGAGEEQNAALARAVIGGLLFATPTTLLVVPYLFAVLRRGNDGKTAHGVFEEGIE